MTPSQINEAIARAVRPQVYLLVKHGRYYRPNACGYTSNLSEAGRYTLEEAQKRQCVHGQPDDVTMIPEPAPNYHGSLDACAEFEKKMLSRERNDYMDQLCVVMYLHPKHFDVIATNSAVKMICATAAQRCEAFLKCRSLWQEEAK